MITIRTINNLFDLTGRKTDSVSHSGKALYYYIPEELLKLNLPLRIIVNGKGIPSEVWYALTPKDNDEIVCAVEPYGGVAVFAINLFKYFAISMAIGAINTWLFPPPDIENPEDTTIYGWNGIRNTARNGQPIGIVYGQHKVGGQIISMFTRTIATNKTELNMLIALCEGIIQDVAGLTTAQDDLTAGAIPASIKINGNSASSYKDVKVSTRIGTNSQTVIPGFEDITNNYDKGLALLYNNAVTITTNGSIDAYVLHLQFPNGIMNTPAGKAVWYGGSVSFSIRHKKSGGAWSAPVVKTVSGFSLTVIDDTYRVDGLSTGVYDIEITRTTADESAIFVGASTLDTVDEIIYDDLAYHNTALLGIKAMATDQLSGATPIITSIIKGRKVPIWNNDDPATFTETWSDNPAWCLLDLLTNTRYGLGDYITTDDLDLTSFKAFADYCDYLVDDGAGGTHKRHTLNIVFDEPMPVWDAVNMICSTARATLIKTGKIIKIKIEEAGSPVQLFTMGNIVKDSFSIEYQSIKDRPNFVEVQFLNQDGIDYDQDIISIEDPQAYANGEDFRKKTVSLYGITRRAQAYREALFLLNINRYLKRTIKFEASIDAIACEVGDIINFQHDVPSWGAGGRVVSATASSITFDQPIVIGAGTYKVRVRHNSDVEEEQTVTDGAGTYTTVNISGSWTTIPKADELYAIGVENILVKPFRIVEIRTASDLTRKITAIEYNANIYTTAIGTIETPTYTQLPNPSQMPPDVTDLSAVEKVTILPDGTLKSSIDIFFAIPIDTGIIATADIWIKENGTAFWRYAGNTKTGYFNYGNDIAVGTTYDIAVSTTSIYGTRKDPEDAPSDTVAITGQATAPDDVTGFGLTRVGDNLYLRWDAVSNLDLKGYEIRIGADWVNSVVLATNITGTQFQTTNFASGIQTFLIKAFNTSGVYSANPDIIIADIGDRINQNIVVIQDEKGLGFPGAKVNCAVNADGDLELTSGELSGSYESQVIDLGAILTSRVTLNYSAYQKDNSLLWQDATFAWNSAEALARTIAGSLSTPYVSTVIKFRYSEDNIVWSSWADFVVGDFQFRYCQFQFTFTSSDINYAIVVNEMTQTVDVPDVFDSDKDVSLIAGNNDISFTKIFLVVPAIAVAIQDGATGDYYEITLKTITGFRIVVKDSAGVVKTAVIDWVCRGY